MKTIIAYLSNPKYLALFLAFVSAGILAFVYVTQYVLHYDPCTLCLYERKPYMAVIAYALAGVLVSRKHPRWTWWFAALCGLSFITGAGIAGFHSGAEYGWWKGLQSCGSTSLPVGNDINALREYLHNRKVVNCEVPIWKLFDLSMAAYNFIVSVLLTAFTFFFLWRARKA